MSEGKVYYCNGANNLTIYVGSLEIKFFEGRYPKGSKRETRPEYIAAIESSPDYGRLFESEEDREKRLSPDPKAQAALLEQALEAVAKMPGVNVASPAPQPQSEEPPKDQELKSEQSAQIPSLTEVSKMNKPKLKSFCDMAGIEVTESDTVAILKKKVRAWIKAETI